MRRLALTLPVFGIFALALASATPRELGVNAGTVTADLQVSSAGTPDPAINDCRPLTIAKGEHSAWGLNAGFAGAELIISTPDAWAFFWQAHVGSTAPVPPPPVDFQRQVVIAVIQGPQSSGGGPNIAITELVPRGPIVIIRVFDDRRPGPLAVMTNPFHIVSVPRTCLPPGSVAFEKFAPLPDTSVVVGRVSAARPDAAKPAAPLPGAKVTLTGAAAVDVRTALTGLDGSFFFVNVAAGAYQLGAIAPGFQPAAVPLPVPPNALVNHEFVLLPLPPTSGAITGHTAQPDPATNIPAPLPGTLVELRQQDQVVQQTNSGPDGAYGFPQVAPGAYVLRASHEGFVSQSIPVVVGPGQSIVQDFLLQPATPPPGSITGHTTQQDPATGVPAPLPNTLLELRKADQTILQTTSGPDGAYAFPRVAPNAYVLRASHEGFIPQSIPVVVSPGQSIVQDFLLQPATTTPGAITGHTAQQDPATGAPAPLPNTLVELRQHDQTLQQTNSANDGSYGFATVAPGAYILRASHDGFLTLALPVVVGPGQSVIQDFILQHRPPAQSGTFQGHVRGVGPDNDEIPLAQALVRLLNADGTEFRHARTDPQGAFVMLDVPPRHYAATAQKDGWQPATAEIDIVAGQPTEHNFLLQPTPPAVTATSK